jgi:hypothetical protein
MSLNDRQPKTSLVMPILLITVGAVFLFKNWHPGFEPYQILRTYWPLILILVGLGKIWDSSRQRAAAPGERNTGIALGSTLGIVAFVFVLVILLGHYQKTRGHETHGQYFANHTQQTIDLQGAKSVSADLHMGAGQLNVSGGSGHLLNAEFHFDRKWDEPTVDYRVSDGKGIMDVNQERGHTNFGPSDNTWDLDFTDEVPLDLRVEMGARARQPETARHGRHQRGAARGRRPDGSGFDRSSQVRLERFGKRRNRTGQHTVAEGCWRDGARGRRNWRSPNRRSTQE